MNTKNHIKVWSVIGLMLAILSIESCKKLVQIPANLPNQVVTAQVFEDSADAIAGVVNLYTAFSGYPSITNLSTGGMTVLSGLSADELEEAVGDGLDYECYINNIPVSDPSGTLTFLWRNEYSGTSGIYDINACIEGMTASTGISAALKNQLIGECEVMRAFYYFNLVNLWGGVPLETTTSYQVNESLPRASIQAVYTQIIADLKDAQTKLNAVYPSTGRARPNIYTASALLAKVYLYQGDYSDAYAQSNAVIGSGLYSLVADLNQVFLDGSTEAIWQIPAYGTIVNYPSVDGRLFVPYSSTNTPIYWLTNVQLDAFESGDQRAVDWLSYNTIGGAQYYYPYKYKNYQINGNATDEDYMIFRLAEQYLIRAEAEANGQGGGATAAIADLNTIRARAGLAATTVTPAGGLTQLMAAIMHERQTELFCEWGNRWLDLKRTGTVQTVLAPEKGGPWLQDAHASLFPIDQTDINYNPQLVQNPGY
jgi:hypothetical protein